VAIVKGLLRDLALAIGITCLWRGFVWMIQGWLISHIEPEYGNTIAGYGMEALLFGSLFCCVAWERAKEKNVCPNCRGWMADGVNICPCCEMEVN
jgi:hypothetical protein